MCNHQVPPIVQNRKNVPLYMITWNFRIQQITGPSIMPPRFKCFPNNTTKFTRYQDSHAKSFPFYVILYFPSFSCSSHLVKKYYLMFFQKAILFYSCICPPSSSKNHILFHFPLQYLLQKPTLSCPPKHWWCPTIGFLTKLLMCLRPFF